MKKLTNDDFGETVDIWKHNEFDSKYIPKANDKNMSVLIDKINEVIEVNQMLVKYITENLDN